MEGPISSFLVSPSAARLVLMTTEYGFSKIKEHAGTHSVKKHGDIFFKKDSGMVPLCPGMEIAASLLHSIIFDDMAINPVSLFKINRVGTKSSQDKSHVNALQMAVIEGKSEIGFFAENPSLMQEFVDNETDYIVQTSLCVPERGFDVDVNDLQNGVISVEEFSSRIHRGRFSSLYLSGLLLAPSDNKDDNFRREADSH